MEAVRNGESALGLLLEWQGGEISALENQTLQIGRDGSSDLPLWSEQASRKHATIRLESRSGRFELVDHSTNGTFVQLEDGQVHHVHRSTLPIWGDGFLSFGEPVQSESVVRFRHV